MGTCRAALTLCAAARPSVCVTAFSQAELPSPGCQEAAKSFRWRLVGHTLPGRPAKGSSVLLGVWAKFTRRGTLSRLCWRWKNVARVGWWRLSRCFGRLRGRPHHVLNLDVAEPLQLRSRSGVRQVAGIVQATALHCDIEGCRGRGEPALGDRLPVGTKAPPLARTPRARRCGDGNVVVFFGGPGSSDFFRLPCST
jgi:hypothetical protein